MHRLVAGEGSSEKILPSMMDQAKLLTLDKSRLVRKLGAISQARMKEVNAALAVSLGIGP